MKNKAFQIIFCLFFLLLLSPSLLYAEEDDSIHAKEGIDQNRVVFSNSPNEHIDPFSGALTLTYTDLRFPGNGGLDLEIVRTYNSKRVCRMLGHKAPELTFLGYGWNIHFGRFKKLSGKTIIFELQDASHLTANVVFNSNYTEYITKEYHKVDHTPSAPWETVLKLTDGTRISFNHMAHDGYYYAKSIRKNGSEIRIFYKSNNYTQIDHVIDSVGRRVNFNYNKIGGITRLVSISCPNEPSLTVTYGYAAVNPHGVSNPPSLLSKAQPPTGAPWKYTYDDENEEYDYIDENGNPVHKTVFSCFEIETVTTPFGGTITYLFDTFYKPIALATSAYYRAVAKKIVAGRGVARGEWTFSYAKADGYDFTTITDPCGRKIFYRFFGYGSNLSNGQCWAFGMMNLKEVTDANGNIKEQVYTQWKPSDKAISQVDDKVPYLCVGTVTLVPLPTKQQVYRDQMVFETTYNNYDEYGNARTVTESSAAAVRTTTATFWYNTENNIVKGKPLTVTVAGNSDFPGTFTTSYEYNANGQPNRVDQYGVVSQYAYDAQGNLQSIIDPNNNTTSYVWEHGRIKAINKPLYSVSKVINWNGTVASETNGRGHTTSFEYDNNLRMTRVVPPAGNPTIYEYAADNSHKLERHGENYAYAYFDGLGRQSGTRDRKGVTTSTVYKACELKDRTASNVGDTVYYDPFGRPTTIIHKDNSTISYKYVTNSVEVTDEAGNKATQYYAAFGSPDDKLLTYVEEANANITAYEYNILGSLTNIWQNKGVIREYVYDAKNFLVSESHPESGITTYTRFPMGNLKTKTDSLGTTTYAYDSHNRLTQTVAGSETIAYAYDKADNLATLINPTASYAYSHDAGNRLTFKEETIDNKSYTIEYSYDGNSNITEIRYPSGLRVNYAYNKLDQVTSVTGFGGSVSSVNYYTSGPALGLMKDCTYSNGIKTDFTYTNRQLLSRLRAGSNVLDRNYMYDSRGNLTSIGDGLHGDGDKRFEYDALNRLTAFDGPWGTGSFEYDVLGNRTSKEVNGDLCAYYFSGNRLRAMVKNSGQGGYYSYEYNDSGDVTSISKDSTTYTLSYDPLHRLTGYYQYWSPKALFAYDGNGQRVSKMNGDSEATTYYHYDQQGNSLTENDTYGNSTDYIYLYGKLIAKKGTKGGDSPPETAY